MKKLLTILLLLPLFVNAGLFYASPTGSGTGTLASPFGLKTVFTQPSTIHPGDTIYLLAGTYKGNYISKLTGTLVAPIILRNNPGDRVIIDGSRVGLTFKDSATLTIQGAYTWYRGLEVTNSDPSVRTASFSGSDRRGIGFDVFGIGVKIINCIVYDTGGGFGAWTPAANSEYYGNIIFNNGWAYPGGLTGHGIYTQNDTGKKTYGDNIVFNNFGAGIKIYAEAGTTNNFYLEGNVNFNDQWIMGGIAPINNLELNSNYGYNNGPEFGYLSKLNNGLTLRNNYFPSTWHLKWWKNVTAKSNTFFAGTYVGASFDIIFEGPTGPPDLSTFAFDSNTYFWPSTMALSQYYWYWNNSAVANNWGQIFLPAWQQSGRDVNGKFKLFPKSGNSLVLSGKDVFVRPNKYDPNKFTVIVYNWDKSATVKVGSFLNSGDQYELHNVQNYFGDVVTGIYADSLVVSMTGHTVAKPLGWGNEIAPSTFPEFGVFELIRTPALAVDPCPQIDSLINLVTIMQGQMIGLQGSLDSALSVFDAQISTIGNLNTRLFTLEAALTGLQLRVTNLKAITTIQ